MCLAQRRRSIAMTFFFICASTVSVGPPPADPARTRPHANQQRGASSRVRYYLSTAGRSALLEGVQDSVYLCYAPCVSPQCT
jgi:hypothetical protein